MLVWPVMPGGEDASTVSDPIVVRPVVGDAPASAPGHGSIPEITVET